MPVFDVEMNGRQFEIEAPDMAAAQAALSQHVGGSSAAANAESSPASLEDVGKSAASGIGRGLIGIAGMFGDVPDMLARGTNAAGNAIASGLGFEPYQLPDKSRTLNRHVPTGADVTKAVEGVTGPLYQPKSTAGKFANTVGEFLPSALVGGPGGIAMRTAAGAVLPGVASEAAGQLAQGSGMEGAARFGGAMLGAMAPGAALRTMTPNPIAAERAAAVNTLRNEGVDLTASMATGSRFLKAAESELGSTAYLNRAEQVQEQFTAAVLRRAGIQGETRATPQVINAAEDRIGNVFNTVAARNPNIPLDQQFVREANRVADDFINLTGQRSPLIDGFVRQIQSTGQRPNISGQSYQALQSDIARYARAAQQPELRMALQDLRSTLDAGIERGLRNPRDLAEWRQARREWANMMQIVRAVSTSTEAAANGLILPAKMQQAIDSMRRGNYARGRGDFADLVRAGNQLMKGFQDSGTSTRLRSAAVPAAFGAVAGAGFGALPGAALGIAAPFVAGRTLMSRPAQAYLQNQRFADMLGRINTRGNVAGQAVTAPTRDSLYQTLMGM